MSLLLAVLGRGILCPHFLPTEDIEVCDNKFAHRSVAISPDDDHPNCIVGGSSLNLEAAHLLIWEHNPDVIVCAYGGRSPYLVSSDAPSESEVMTAALREQLEQLAVDYTGDSRPWLNCTRPEFVVWPKDRPTPEGTRSNALQELINIFELALERGVKAVTIVTVTVQVPRVTLFANNHRRRRPEFQRLTVGTISSEEVLMDHDARRYAPRVAALFASKAFARTAKLEERGISDFLAGKYQ